MPNYRYNLDKSSKKYPCPLCGKKSFVVYTDRRTGDPIDSAKYGRCDRENNCGHHLHPKEDSELVSEASTDNQGTVQKVEIVQIYPDEAILKPLFSRTRKCVSPLHIYAKQKGISVDHMLKWEVLTDGANEERTAFVFRNLENKVVNIKWITYGPDGHRIKSINSFSLKQPPHTPPKKAKKKLGGNTEIPAASGQHPIKRKYLLSLYGEHLLDPEKKRVVCVVESEKSAYMASYFYPQYDWVACGSANGLSDGSNETSDKITPLMNRTVWWLADADKAGRDNSSLRNLRNYGIDHQLVDLFPDRNDGWDIGDAIDAGLRPDIEEAARESKKVASAMEVNDKFREGKDITGKDEEMMGLLYELPKGCSWKEVKDDVIRYGQFEYKNQMYVVKERVKDTVASYYSNRVSNFSIKPLGLIASKLDPRRLVEITNRWNITKVLEIPTKAFASNTEFTVFVESEGNFQWNGSAADLKKVRSRLYDKMKDFEEIDTLGWHATGIFIFANGIFNGQFHPINKYGFVSPPDKDPESQKAKHSYYIPPLSCIHQNNDEEWEDEKKFVYVTRDKVTLKDWADQYCKVHKNNGVISLVWFIASLYRDFIYRRFKFFPHLFLFGPPGTGKSQVGWSIRSMGFNGIKKPFALSGGTQVAFHREFSHFCNFPAWLDEYDNSIDYARVQSIKNAYDGTGHKKSVKDSDKRTKTVPVNSGVMISGQQLPIADNALFKRVILCQFHQTEFSETEKKSFKDLQDMEEGGLSFITAGFMKLRKDIEKNYLDTFEKVLQEYTDRLHVAYEIEDRIFRNMCVIAAVLKVLEPKIKAHLPFTYEEFTEIALHNLKEQMNLISNANEIHTFWDMVSYMIDQGLVEDEKDFKFRAKSEITIYYDGEVKLRQLDGPRQVFYMRMSRIVPLYREHFKRQNVGSSPMDKGSLIHYLQHSKAYIGSIKGTRFETGNSSAYAFDYDILESHGIELKRGFGSTASSDPMEVPAGEARQLKLAPGDKDDLPF